jgi:hypothetical protein
MALGHTKSNFHWLSVSITWLNHDSAVFSAIFWNYFKVWIRVYGGKVRKWFDCRSGTELLGRFALQFPPSHSNPIATRVLLEWSIPRNKISPKRNGEIKIYFREISAKYRGNEIEKRFTLSVHNKLVVSFRHSIGEISRKKLNMCLRKRNKETLFRGNRTFTCTHISIS